MTRGSINWIVAALCSLACIIASSLTTQADVFPPYLVEIGTANAISGMVVAPNGYSFLLLSNGIIKVTGPDKIPRGDVNLGVRVPGGGGSDTSLIASNRAVGLDAKTIVLFVASVHPGGGSNEIWKVIYDTEKEVATKDKVYDLGVGLLPQAIDVTPVTPGEAVWVCGSDKVTTPGTLKNFVIRIDPISSEQTRKTWGQEKSFYAKDPRGGTWQVISHAENKVSAIAVDENDKAFVAAQWDAVYFNAFSNYGPFFFDNYSFVYGTPTYAGGRLLWSVSDAGLSGVGGENDNARLEVSVGDLPDHQPDTYNKSAYIVKFEKSSDQINPTAYSAVCKWTTSYYYNYYIARPAPNESVIADLKTSGGYLYAGLRFTGYSFYGAENAGFNLWSQVIQTDKNLSVRDPSQDSSIKWYTIKENGGGSGIATMDVSKGDDDNSTDDDVIYIGGYLGDASTTFSAQEATQVAGKGYFFASLPASREKWKVKQSTVSAGNGLGGLRMRVNEKSHYAEVGGTIYGGQLKLGSSVVPPKPATGAVNFFSLLNNTGDWIGQLGVTVFSDFVSADQVRVGIGGNPPAPLSNFDATTGQGSINLLSDSIGESVTITVPPRVYVDAKSRQIEPDYDSSHNEKAPAAAVTQHICTGFSVSGDTPTAATNTYSFVLSEANASTSVKFNWRTEHRLVIDSAVQEDLNMPEGNALALGHPDPAVNIHWMEANQPVVAAIDGVSLDFSTYGKRYRVIGFDATGSALLRPPPLPPMPALRVLLTTDGALTAGQSAVSIADDNAYAKIKVGWRVEAQGIPAGTTVSALLGGGLFRMSNSYVGTAPQTIRLKFYDSRNSQTANAAFTQDSPDVVLSSSVPDIVPGTVVSGLGIAAGTIVENITDSTHVTLSKPMVALSLTSKILSPPQPTVVATTTSPNANSATVPAWAGIQPGMLVVGKDTGGNDIFLGGTKVTNVVDLPSSAINWPSDLTNGNASVKANYNASLLPNLSVSGPGVPPGTRIEDIQKPIVSLLAALTKDSTEAYISNDPSVTRFPAGAPVSGPGIAQVGQNSALETTVQSIEEKTVSMEAIADAVNPNSLKAGLDSTFPLTNAYLTGVGVDAGTIVTSVADISEPVTASVVNGQNTISLPTGTTADSIPLGAQVGPDTLFDADTRITSISTDSNNSITTLTLNHAAKADATEVQVASKSLTLNKPVNFPGKSVVAFNSLRLTLSQAAVATVNYNHNFVTGLLMTFSKNATTTTTSSPLSYILERSVTFSSPSSSAGGTYDLAYAMPPATTTTVHVASTADLAMGMKVQADGIVDGTTIVSIDDASNTIELSTVADSSADQEFQYFRDTGALTFSTQFGSFAFDSVQDRQQVPQWIMSGPATIKYRWTTQYSVQASTSVNAAKDMPEVRLDSADNALKPTDPGYGSAQHWFDEGSHVFIGARFGGVPGLKQLRGWLTGTNPPFSSESKTTLDGVSVYHPTADPQSPSNDFYYREVVALDSPILITWDFGGVIHKELVTIGNAATFNTAPPLDPSGVTTNSDLVNGKQSDRMTLVSGPTGSAANDMVVWDAKGLKLYPLRPGTVLLEYDHLNVANNSDPDPVIVELTSGFPGDPIPGAQNGEKFAGVPSHTHITHPDLPGVILDPSAKDATAFNKLAYSSGDATANGGEFVSTQNGKTTLIYTKRGDSTPANGDLTKETLSVKVVETKQWDDPTLLSSSSTPADIGAKVTHTDPTTSDILDTGFVVHKKARYNAEAYDRTKIVGSGPIIPVNQQFTSSPENREDELVVIWFSKPDLETGVMWGNSVERFAPQWPLQHGRIVQASRLGSEGKDTAGNDQLSFSTDKYENVKIYNQPDRDLPGFNPNEEHALIAPSYKYLDQANPPPVAYALQTGRLNKLTHDANYTSEPYVLVQYTDKAAKQTKMAVYSVQAEDFAAELNPYVDPVSKRKFPYTFNYDMTVGAPVQPPYPLNRVIGFQTPRETFGVNKPADRRVYWEDYNGVGYAAGQGSFDGYFYYPQKDEFWNGEGNAAVAPGTAIPFGNAPSSNRLGARVQGTVEFNNEDGYNGGNATPVFRTLYAADAGHESPSFKTSDGSALSFEIIAGYPFAATTITLASSSSAIDFAQAVNAKMNGKVSATVTANGLVLESVTGIDLILTDGNGSPLATAGFKRGVLPRQPSQFTATLTTGKPVTVNVKGRTVSDFIKGVNDAFPNGGLRATVQGSGAIQLAVSHGVTLTLADGFGTPLQSAGFAIGVQPIESSILLTAAQFALNDSFTATADGQPIAVKLTAPTANPSQQVFAASELAAVITAKGMGKINAAIESGHLVLYSNAANLTLTDGAGSPLAKSGLSLDQAVEPSPVSYTAYWPENAPILKAGETLTFAGGEYRADHPTAPGLPGVIGWASGEVIFDSLNPTMDTQAAFTHYTARLISPLEPRTVSLGTKDEVQSVVNVIQPATGMTTVHGTVWKFNNLPASLARRLSYDPLTGDLTLIGYVNDKTLGDSSLTAAPGPVTVLEPNILTQFEKQAMLDVPQLASNQVWVGAVNNLYKTCRNPNTLSNGSDQGETPYYVGLNQAYQRDPFTGDVKVDPDGNPLFDDNAVMPSKVLGPGMALVPSPEFLDPLNPSTLKEGYITLVENNDKNIGGPVTLHVVKVSRNDRFRGAIKTIASDNVFSEQLTLRHSGDFGGNEDDIVYQWFYREEDGTEVPVPPNPAWNLFADNSNSEPQGLGMNQIELKGNPSLLLADQLFFVRYRHKNEVPAGGTDSTNWANTKWEEYGSEFAGAANSFPGAYKPQLAMGWVKRVLDRINPYEARFNDFQNNTAPATYTSMIQEAGQRFEGPVALNPDKDVVENLGLIELYQTVLDRGRNLSIDLSSPITTPGINNALLLAATRVTDLYLLLGNEAYSDAQDPTIGFGTSDTDYGSAAASIFTFENQVPSLLDEELALLRGISETYGRPVYNRLFWNFTKSEGEVAYAMNYNITDVNRDGFIDEKDAMIMYPQGHGDAWGHYLSAIKSQYGLLRNPYFNWVSRSEYYNLLDVVIKVDYLDERKFADAAAARARTGAEIVGLTYRSRYVEDPDGQWQGYTDTDTDRAWGVDEWARRAGQGAYFDWVAANSLIPANDPTHTGIQKVDRSTVTAIQTISAQIGKIQSTEDDANNGLNPMGLAPDVISMDFNPLLTGQIDQDVTQFEQVAGRAEDALANATAIFDYASQQSNRIRMQEVNTANFSQQTYEQDRDYRNQLIEIFGTPYSGQIGAGKAYPAGYNGPDIALYMYVDVNDINANTVPKPSESGGFTDYWASLPQLVTVDPKSVKIGNDTVTVEPQFTDIFNRYFLNDVLGGNPSSLDKQNDPGVFADPAKLQEALKDYTSVDSYWHDMSLGKEMNLPAQASSYTFQAPADWGKRSAPGELQAEISELVQAQAALSLSVADYDGLKLQLQAATKALRAEQGVDSEVIMIMDKARTKQRSLSQAIAAIESVGDALDLVSAQIDRYSTDAADSVIIDWGTSIGIGAPAKGILETIGDGLQTGLDVGVFATKVINRALEVEKETLSDDANYEIQKAQFNLDIQKSLGEIEQMLWSEAQQRVVVFQQLEAMREASDRYRATLKKGQALLDERADFNRKAAGAAQQIRYQDMGFRVFRNDALQKYRAAFDLAARYVYLAARAYDYETNLDPNDPASAQPLLQEIPRARTLGSADNGVSDAGGLASILGKLKANYSVLKGRLGLSSAQVESTGFSLMREQARANPASWKQLLQNSRTDDLWTVPEFRRYCRPPAPRSAGKLPGLVIPFSTETTFGRNFFGRPLAAGDMAYNPTNFANKISSAGVAFEGYPIASLAAAPQVYLVPVGVDVMTVPNSPTLTTRSWNVIDQAMPVPFPVNNSNLKDTSWIPVTDGLNGPLAEIRRFSSFRAGVTAGEAPQATDTRLAGRSVWNTKWLLIIPGGNMLNDGNQALDQFINNVTDIKLQLNTYGYSGN